MLSVAFVPPGQVWWVVCWIAFREREREREIDLSHQGKWCFSFTANGAKFISFHNARRRKELKANGKRIFPTFSLFSKDKEKSLRAIKAKRERVCKRKQHGLWEMEI